MEFRAIRQQAKQFQKSRLESHRSDPRVFACPLASRTGSPEDDKVK